MNKETQQEYITVPNSDIKFLKPDFHCELLQKLSTGIVAEIKLDDEDCDYVLFDYTGMLLTSLDDYSYHDCVSLTPYIEPKKWYEDESNFPYFLNDLNKTIKEQHKYIFCPTVGIAEQYNATSNVRLATDEEIDTLKFKS